ncbi:alpha/beta hydrolase [Leucobacter sp. USHLN153]|uniref:alpha/beta hydrolase n=1 Tax=Leucobacter sp. USHLN153 TaxID=3081268 RepID=UPI00301B145F
MTMFVPASPEEVLIGSPVRGTSDEIATAARFARLIEDDLNRVCLAVSNAATSLGLERGAAITAVVSRLRDVVEPGATQGQASAAQGSRALFSYASAVESLHSSAARVRSDVEEALETIRRSAEEISELAAQIGAQVEYRWDEGAPGALPEPRLGAALDPLSPGACSAAVQHLRALSEQPWLAASARWHAAIERVRAARRTWRGLIDERRSVESSILRELRATTVGQLLSLAGDGRAARVAAVSSVISGELAGVPAATPRLRTSHPGLERLIGRVSGAAAWESPPHPAETAARWNRLSSAEQKRLIAEVPWVIGNLPGLPYADRDRANRALLDFYRAYSASLTPDQLQLMAEVSLLLEAEAEEVALRGAARPPVQLVALDTSGATPRAAVGYGNLDAADVATWEVAGMNSDAHCVLESWNVASRNVYFEQGNVQGASQDRSVVAWLGYDTPDGGEMLEVLGPHSARRGSERLAVELDGLHEARAASGSEASLAVSVLGHSYGTTVAANALARVEHPVNSFIMLGSAGLDTHIVPSLNELGVREVSNGQAAIYTTHASADRLAPLGAGLARRGQPNADARAPFWFPAHDASPVYGGALSFSSEGDPERDLKRTDGHGVIGEGKRPGIIGISASEGHGYLDRQTESLMSVAELSTGKISADLQSSLERSSAECVVGIKAPLSTMAPRRVDCEVAR